MQCLAAMNRARRAQAAEAVLWDMLGCESEEETFSEQAMEAAEQLFDICAVPLSLPGILLWLHYATSPCLVWSLTSTGCVPPVVHPRNSHL